MSTAGAELLSIGEMAARTGVSTSTLRAWEERLGVPHPTRTGGGQRRYPSRDVLLIDRIQAARGRGLSLEEAAAWARGEREVGRDSLYAALRRDHPGLDVVTVSAQTLLALTWAIEDECLVHASHPLLLGCFQDRAAYVASGRRWRELARSARAAVVFSDFEVSAPDAAPARVALPADSPLLNEWSLLCLDPQVSAALVAWERPGRSAGAGRRFEAVVSTEPDVVHGAVRRGLDIAAEAGVPWPAAATASLATGGGAADARAVSLLRRFAGYADARIR